MKGRLVFGFCMCCIFGFAGCDNGTSDKGTAPTLTGFDTIAEVDGISQHWSAALNFAAGDVVYAGIRGTDPDGDVVQFVFVLRQNGAAQGAPIERDVTVTDTDFEQFIGLSAFAAGEYTLDVYARDRKGNTSNTLSTAAFTVM